LAPPAAPRRSAASFVRPGHPPGDAVNGGMRERLLELLEPCVNARGFELIDLECQLGQGRGLVRLYIDRPGGVTLDDCAEVSEQVSGVLDVEDLIPTRYVLEVSSPGEDRVLRTRSRRVTGTLRALEDDVLALEVDGETIEVPMSAVGQARLAPQS
jgi:ribosome maturation factor RimP